MLNRLKDVVFALTGMDIVQLLLVSFLVKGFFNSFDYSEVAVCTILVGATCFRKYLASKTPEKAELDAELRAELDSLKATVNALKMERNLSQPTSARQKFF